MTCRECGEAFETEELNFSGIVMPAPTICSHQCSDSYDRKARAETRRTKWRELMGRQCPSLLKTDPAHPDMPSKVVQDKILSWKVGPMGLVLPGPTGTCKTRMLFLLIKRLWVDDGVNVKWYLPGQIGKSMINAIRQDAYEEFTEALANVPVLAIDDLGKEKVTEKSQELLFDIINARVLRERPMLITTNFVGPALEKRFPDPLTAGPLVERIRNNCENITMQKGKK